MWEGKGGQYQSCWSKPIGLVHWRLQGNQSLFSSSSSRYFMLSSLCSYCGSVTSLKKRRTVQCLLIGHCPITGKSPLLLLRMGISRYIDSSHDTEMIPPPMWFISSPPVTLSISLERDIAGCCSEAPVIVLQPVYWSIFTFYLNSLSNLSQPNSMTFLPWPDNRN